MYVEWNVAIVCTWTWHHLTKRISIKHHFEHTLYQIHVYPIYPLQHIFGTISNLLQPKNEIGWEQTDDDDDDVSITISCPLF